MGQMTTNIDWREKISEMRHRKFGSTKREVAIIGQGTWYGKDDNRDSAIKALRRGLDLGMTHIDTAEMYLSGRAEEWVAEAILRRRDEVFLVSKVLPHNASRKGTVIACEASLARLKTDRLDCYLLHWRGDHPLDATIEAFQQLQTDGKILSWGVSNFDAPDLKEAYRRGGHAGPVCDQVLYHLQERAVEHAVVPWCEKHDAAFVAYSPFGHGDFPDPDTPGGRLLEEIAKEHNATVRQVALQYLLRWPFSFLIPKASDIDHVVENAGAGDLELTGLQIERLNKMFALGPPRRGLPML
jgi:diketogulonate reductase-like aldo/keto reductase